MGSRDSQFDHHDLIPDDQFLYRELDIRKALSVGFDEGIPFLSTVDFPLR